MKSSNIFWATLFFLGFFIAGLLTLNDYGISWDEPTHFKRGQAYLHYFLTGKLTYENLPEYDLEKAKSKTGYHERSLYQSDAQNGLWHLAHDGGHPPLNGILAAASNYIFYQKLEWVGDVESYHLFNIFVSSLLVAIVFLFAAGAFGIWAGVFSVVFLATYPLFWAESHFNIKDPAETAFFSGALYFFWKAIDKKKIRFILLSSIFAGLAFSTKFNILFTPFILGPWFLLLLRRNREEVLTFVFSKKSLLSLFIYPIVMLLIFLSTWPYIWQDIWANTLSVFGYYKEIGTESNLGLSLLLSRWNTYAFQWVLFTTQPLMLLFFLLGVLQAKRLWQRKSAVFALWGIWFVVTILRVSAPGTSIYGGVRQIMEYIPPMALIAGVGSYWALERVKLLNRYALSVLLFMVLVIPLVYLHPNENVYFNSLAGGLKGAIDRGIPSAGFSFGNAYYQGIKWLNENAEQGAKLALIQGTVLNVPEYMPRPDIRYSNNYWSGINREGEYLMELTYNYELKVYHYAWEYVEKMLEPVYQVKVDGVPILTIWKNDIQRTRPEYRKEEVVYEDDFDLKIEGNTMEISLPEKVLLSRMIIEFSPERGCYPPSTNFIETSLDSGRWRRERDYIPLPVGQISGIQTVGNDQITYFFAAREAQYIKFIADAPSSCVFLDPDITLVILK